jgi:hypothetical protein
MPRRHGRQMRMRTLYTTALSKKSPTPTLHAWFRTRALKADEETAGMSALEKSPKERTA